MLENMKSNVNYIKMNDSFVNGLGLFYYSTRTEQDFYDYYVNGYGWDPKQDKCDFDYCKIGLQFFFFMHTYALLVCVCVCEFEERR